MAYRFTGLPLHLETAKRCTDCFLDKLKEQVDDSVALWDFAWPGERGADRRDVSAAVLVASSTLELAGYVSHGEAERYRKASANILKSVEGGYLGDYSRTMGTLVHATVTNPRFDSGAGQDVSLPYADYYAVEAMRRSAAAAAVTTNTMV